MQAEEAKNLDLTAGPKSLNLASLCHTMRLRWTQLRAVVFLLMLISLNLASADFNDAIDTLDHELDPFTDLNTGYLPFMPAYTVHSILVSFILVEATEKDNNKTLPNFQVVDGVLEFRNAKAADSLVEYLKQMRSFKNFIALTGPIVQQIASQVVDKDITKDQVFRRRKVCMPLLMSLPFATRWNADGPQLVDVNDCSAAWKDLIRYPVSSWNKYQNDKYSLDKDDLYWQYYCNEAALRWTVFDKIKQNFQAETAVFQAVLDCFMEPLVNDRQEQAKLLSYILQFGVRRKLFNMSKNSQLEAEFLELYKDSSQEYKQIKLFNKFLIALGLMTETIDNQALRIHQPFKSADFTEIEFDLDIPGWEYFEMLNTTADVLVPTTLLAIFDGFYQYNLGNSLDGKDVFKWNYVILFIASYGHMFERKMLKKSTMKVLQEPNSDSKSSPHGPPRGGELVCYQPQVALPKVKVILLPDTRTEGVILRGNLLNSIVYAIRRSPKPNEGDSILKGIFPSEPADVSLPTKPPQKQLPASKVQVWSSLTPLQQTLAIIVPLLVVGIPLLLYWPRNTTELPSVTPNSFGDSSVPDIFTSWTGIIVILVVVAMLAVSGGVGWWWYTRNQAKLMKTADRKKANQKKDSSPQTSTPISPQTPATLPVLTSRTSVKGSLAVTSSLAEVLLTKKKVTSK